MKDVSSSRNAAQEFTVPEDGLIDERADKLLKLHQGHATPYHIDYFGVDLKLLPDVFCPAYGEGSYLLGHYLTYTLQLKKSDVVLDIGTGSGALAILAAKKVSKVVATDLSPVAVKCARENVTQLGLDEIVTVVHGDLFEQISPEGQFSIVLFNAPFMEGNPTDWLRSAMYDKNFDTLTSFVKKVGGYLKESGCIYISFSNCGDVSYLNRIAKEESLNIKVVQKISGALEFYIFELTK